VLGGLAEHDVRENVRPALIQTQDRGRRFIAAGFDAEDCQRFHARSIWRVPPTCASG